MIQQRQNFCQRGVAHYKERAVAGSYPGLMPLKQLVRESTDVIEALCIEAALKLTQDNRAAAAELLGLSRQSLYTKLRRFDIGDSEDTVD